MSKVKSLKVESEIIVSNNLKFKI